MVGVSSSLVVSSVGVSVSLLARNVFLLLAFLLISDGLFCFLATGAGVFTLVSKEKEKWTPILRENLKSWPWFASVWQKARHWDVRQVSTSLTSCPDIFQFI